MVARHGPANSRKHSENGTNLNNQKWLSLDWPTIILFNREYWLIRSGKSSRRSLCQQGAYCLSGFVLFGPNTHQLHPNALGSPHLQRYGSLNPIMVQQKFVLGPTVAGHVS